MNGFFVVPIVGLVVPIVGLVVVSSLVRVTGRGVVVSSQFGLFNPFVQQYLPGKFIHDLTFMITRIKYLNFNTFSSIFTTVLIRGSVFTTELSNTSVFTAVDIVSSILATVFSDSTIRALKIFTRIK